MGTMPLLWGHKGGEDWGQKGWVWAYWGLRSSMAATNTSPHGLACIPFAHAASSTSAGHGGTFSHGTRGDGLQLKPGGDAQVGEKEVVGHWHGLDAEGWDASSPVRATSKRPA